MTEKSLFISTCSRRQLARRRSARVSWRYGIPPTLLVVGSGIAAYLAGRGSI